MHSAEVGVLPEDFKTLGDLWSAWIEQHCRIPDRHERGRAFVEYDWQFWCTAHHGQIRPDATYDPETPPLNQAFVFRRSQIIAPQKMGKGPWTATHVSLAAVGPSEFAGWAGEGDIYRCSDNGCGCGWEYEYLAGEPKGRRHPSPLIQIMASSEEQVTNIWRPLVSMIQLGPLRHLLLPRGEFIRIIGEAGDKDMDRIDRVTASAQSRLGAPLSKAFGDETGTFLQSNKLIAVWETMRRGAAGMGGRSMETTNAFDPAQNSAAQRTQESQREDIFRFWRDPDKVLRRKDGTALSFNNARERRRILEYVYSGAKHIIIPSIEAEALELMEIDLAQAERFFGNRLVRGAGGWMPPGLWESAHAAVLAS
ncbi:MAG: phage protein [Nocardioidaceae bacterium]|nr:phage protein [Nocardioidaceae bacterium]